MVDAWQLSTWDSYRDVARLGRKTRLGGTSEAILWSIFERVRSELAERDLVTLAVVFAAAVTLQRSGVIFRRRRGCAPAPTARVPD